MIEEIRKLEERKQKLLGLVRDTKERKKGIIKIVQDLISQFNSGRISKQEYNEKLRSSLDKRSSEQWIKYYDDFLAYYDYQIKLCERLIKEGKRDLRRQTLKRKGNLILKVLIVFVFFILIISLFFIFKPKLQELVEEIGEEGVVATQAPIFLDSGVQLIDESLVQYQAVLGKPVKWKKEFVIDSIADFKVELPEGSENVMVKQIKDGEEKDISSIVEVDKKGIFSKRVEVGIDKKTITGNAVLNVGEGEIGYEIEFETSAPEISEKEINRGKRITIRGPEGIHYENILSFTKLPQDFAKSDIGKVKLYEIKNGQKIATEFSIYDTDEDGLFDFIEWITPYLSEAVFEIIIEISKAEHLDSRKNFISDIYEQVKEQDDVWSEEILDGHYIRVTFEEMLDNEKDITLYPRVVSGNPKVEVYEVDSSEKIAEFESLTKGKNTIYLTALEGSQDVFDLRVVSGSIEIDYIVDPVSVLFTNVSETCHDVWAYAVNLCLYSKWTLPGSGDVQLTRLWQWSTESLAADEQVEMAIYFANGTQVPGTSVLMNGTGDADWIGENLTSSVNISLGDTYYFGSTSSDHHNQRRDESPFCEGYLPNEPSKYTELCSSLEASVGSSTSSYHYIIPGISYTIDPVIEITSIGGDLTPVYFISDNAPLALITTDENADCRSSIDGDETYDQMSDDVNCGGDGEQLHTCQYTVPITPDGTLTMYFACQDIFGNKNTAENNKQTLVEVDTAPPTQLDHNPAKSSTINTTSLTITFTTNEIGDCRASLLDETYDAMSDKVDCTVGTSTSHSCAMTGLSEGPEMVYIACKDDTSVSPNKDTTETNEDVDYTVDTILPSITITYPEEGVNYETKVTELNYIVSDSNLDSCWYSTDGGETNSSQDINCNNFVGLSSVGGLNTWTVYAKDKGGNGNSVSVTFIEEISYPNISFVPPTPEDGFFLNVSNNIFVNVSASSVVGNISTFIDFDNSLVGWWRMDDISGDGLIVYDNSGYGNDGNVFGNAVQTDDGKLGKGFEFDGDGDYISIPSTNDLVEGVSSFSVCAWAKTHNVEGNYDYIVSQWNDTDNFRLMRDTGENIHFTVINSSLDINTGGYSAGITDTNWHHICGVYNGTYVLVYVDSVAGFTKGKLSGNTFFSNSDPILIGSEGTSEYSWNGTIDDVMIFNRSLSKQEVYGLYANKTSDYLLQDFIDLSFGNHIFKAYVQNNWGDVNETETRTLTIGGLDNLEIVYITDINGYETTASVPSGDRDLSPGIPTQKDFKFYAYSEAGPDAFPRGVDITDTNVVISLVNVDSNKKGNGIHRKSRIVDEGFGCTRGEDANPPAGSPHDTELSAVYTCTVNMQHYDDYGSDTNQNWEIRPYIRDIFSQEVGYDPISESYIDELVQFRTTYFNELTSYRLSPDPLNLNFGIVSFGSSINKISVPNPIFVENLGNEKIDKVNLKSYDIPGATINTEYIQTNWFSVGDGDLEDADVCGASGTFLEDTLSPDDLSLISDILPDIPYGEEPPSLVGTIPKEDLKICLREATTIQGPLSVQSYLTTAQNEFGQIHPWDIEAEFYISMILSIIKFMSFHFKIGLFAVSIIVKKKKKKKKKSSKKKYNLTEQDVIKLKELLEIFEKKKIKEVVKEVEVKVPIIIFRQNVSPAEALSKYLKENLGLKFNEIAKLIHRNERTIWINYNNAIKKKKQVFLKDKSDKRIGIESRKLQIPIEEFSNRKLSILESIINYLKNNGFKNLEIAKILDRDIRNIYTLISRIKKKLR